MTPSPRIELPFSTPAGYEHLCHFEDPGRSSTGAHWFVFRGDQLLLEMGPPDPRPSDDPRVRSRPSWAKLPLRKNHNWLGPAAVRTLYLGRLGGVDCWAAELAKEAPPPEPGLSWEGLRAL